MTYNCYGNHNNQAIHTVYQPRKIRAAKLCTYGWIIWQCCLLSRQELVLVGLKFAYMECISQYNHPVGNIYREQKNPDRQMFRIIDKSRLQEETPSIVFYRSGLSSQLNVSLPVYYCIIQVLATDKLFFPKKSWKGLEVHSGIYQIRIEEVGKGGGDFRNI